MKKTLVATILGIATTVAVMAQGKVNLNTYNTAPYPQITYGAGSGGPVGTGINNTFTIGIYYAAGVVSVGNDPTGVADPATLGALLLGTGPGSTTIANSGAAAGVGGLGWFSSTTDFTVPGVASGQATFVIVAYNGSSYADSTIRGHSAGFLLTPAQGAATAPGVGSAMPTFSVFSVAPIPEPSTFALAGLGLASLVIFRRRK